jgi:hypothetical protein
MTDTVWCRMLCLSLGWRKVLLIVVLTLGAASSAACQNGEAAVIRANKEIGVSFRPSYIAITNIPMGSCRTVSMDGFQASA